MINLQALETELSGIEGVTEEVLAEQAETISRLFEEGPMPLDSRRTAVLSKANLVEPIENSSNYKLTSRGKDIYYAVCCPTELEEVGIL